jgi:hypothetical protein
VCGAYGACTGPGAGPWRGSERRSGAHAPPSRAEAQTRAGGRRPARAPRPRTGKRARARRTRGRGNRPHAHAHAHAVRARAQAAYGWQKRRPQQPAGAVESAAVNIRPLRRRSTRCRLRAARGSRGRVLRASGAAGRALCARGASISSPRPQSSESPGQHGLARPAQPGPHESRLLHPTLSRTLSRTLPHSATPLSCSD